MARKTTELFPNMDFGVVHDIDEKPHVIDFQLHNHDDLYEVVLLLDGDCEFCVEGNTYCPRPNDIVFTRPFEMHKIVCLSERTYNRIILYIKSDYFTHNHCENFLDIFKNRELGTGNYISGDITNHVLGDCINRLYHYSEKGEYELAGHIVFEFLYLMNECKGTPNDFYVKDERVRNIIIYQRASFR